MKSKVVFKEIIRFVIFLLISILLIQAFRYYELNQLNKECILNGYSYYENFGNGMDFCISDNRFQYSQIQLINYKCNFLRTDCNVQKKLLADDTGKEVNIIIYDLLNIQNE